MEKFLFLVLVIVVYNLFIFLINKLLSTTNDHEPDLKKKATHDRKFNGQMKDCDLETERKLGFVSKTELVDDLGESVRHKLAPQELSNESGESLTIIDDPKTYQNELFREVEIADLTENGTEESVSENGVVCEWQENVIDETYKSEIPGEIETDLIKGEVGLAKNEGIEVFKVDGVREGLVDEEDDWEGIERSELERLFSAAVVYVASKINADKITSLGSDLKLKLYGLHKVAIQGPCHVPQPMALKVSARAKWNAWQQLGNMNPEVAMEQYISLLSISIPGWMKSVLGEDGKQDFADDEASRKLASDSNTLLRNQQAALNRDLEELKLCVEDLDLGLNSLKKVN